MIDPFHIFAVYAAANALIALVLGMLVTRARVKTGIAIGDGGGNPALAGPLRAHANNAEYVPIALMLMLIMVILRGSAWLVHAVGLPLTVGRILHGIGLSNSVAPSPLRLLGMVLTWIAYVVAIGSCFLLALIPTAVSF